MQASSLQKLKTPKRQRSNLSLLSESAASDERENASTAGSPAAPSFIRRNGAPAPAARDPANGAATGPILQLAQPVVAAEVQPVIADAQPVAVVAETMETAE